MASRDVSTLDFGTENEIYDQFYLRMKAKGLSGRTSKTMGIDCMKLLKRFGKNRTIMKGASKKSKKIKHDRKGKFRASRLAQINGFFNRGDNNNKRPKLQEGIINDNYPRSTLHNTLIIMPTDADIEKVKLILEEAFEEEELICISDKVPLSIMYKKDYEGAGEYMPWENIVYIGPNSDNPCAIIHETVHRLRETDKNRESVITRSRYEAMLNIENRKLRRNAKANLKTNEVNAEESTTTFETLIRLDFEKDDSHTSYYADLEGCRKNEAVAKEKMRRDRALAVPPGQKNLKGKEAVVAVETKFYESEIGERRPERKGTNKKDGRRKTAKEYLKTIDKRRKV